MKTIQMTIEEALLLEVDSTTKELSLSRSAFIRQALRQALRQHKIRKMEEQHRRGYERIPPDATEEWDEVRAWGDDYVEG